MVVEIENLYNLNGNNETFDSQCYEQILHSRSFLEDRLQDPPPPHTHTHFRYEDNFILNTSILRAEVEKAVYSAKKNWKSTGFDKIPSEVLKFPIMIDVLHSLFNMCFDTGILVQSSNRSASIQLIFSGNTK